MIDAIGFSGFFKLFHPVIMAISKESIHEALKTVRYPGFSRDIVSFGLVQDIAVDTDRVVVRLAVTTADASVPLQLKEAVEGAIGAIAGVATVTCEVAVQTPKGAAAHASEPPQPRALPGVKAVVAVASGKGGVGKSTVAVNLACALDRVLGERLGQHAGVGILDCDIHGPSVPHMLGLTGAPDFADERIIPPENFGIRVMSMALLIDEDAPVVWRGPMINNAITQFIRQVRWGDMEVLVVDLPPGTGDAQLTLVQTLPVNGVVIVTTPQAVATNVTTRGARMFAKVNVPILGVCENMSWLQAADGSRTHIFGAGGGLLAARALDSELLAQVPLDQDIREGGDRGIPIVVGFPDSPAGLAFRELAAHILRKLAI
jgi:ATP-binding protein involved in chromosome partitioning